MSAPDDPIRAAPDLALLLRSVDRLESVNRLIQGIFAIGTALVESGEPDGSPIAEIAETAMRRMDKIRDDIDKYRRVLQN